MAIHVVIAADDNYFPHLAAVVASVIAATPSCDLVFYVIHVGVTDVNLSLLVQWLEGLERVCLRLIEFKEAPYRHFRTDGHITLATYIRLFLPSLLPLDLEKVIYLDADVIVRRNLNALWSVDLKSNLIAGVADPFSSENERLSLPHDYRYVNAGVLLINVEAWRREGLQGRFLAFAERSWDILKFHDQDVLNVVLRGRIHYLPYEWNFQARTESVHLRAFGIEPREYRAMSRLPFIIHYTTNKKPWTFVDAVRFEGYYQSALAQTPWAAAAGGDSTLRERVTRSLNLLRRFTGQHLRSLTGRRSLWRSA